MAIWPLSRSGRIRLAQLAAARKGRTVLPSFAA